MALWRWQELLNACAVPSANGPDITGISIDTRTLEAGDLFVALVAERDGHEFAQFAQSAGAGAILASRDTGCSLPELRTQDTLDGLRSIAIAGRKRMTGKVVGITGSSGKTTARSWLEKILSRQARTHASTGSYNNHWGVPLSLARMPEESEYGIFEIGMNSPGEIEPLSNLVNPDVALLLNVLPAHLTNFDSLDAIRREKLTITTGLKPAGILVVHEDIDLEGLECSNVVTFGLSQSATISAGISYLNNLTNVQVTVDHDQFSFQLKAGGQHRVLTSLACLGIVQALGADLEQACNELSRVEAPAGRGNLLEISGLSIIDDSYNANPVSMRYALEALVNIRSGRRIALLGEMLELGKDEQGLHKSVLDICAGLDGVITVGQGFTGAEKHLGAVHWGHFDSTADIDLEHLTGLLQEGDTILVKGSNKVFWVNNFVKALTEFLN